MTLRKHRIGIILFARMSSHRLPGKMLCQVGSTTLLERVVVRARLLDQPIILATSCDPSDDSLVAAANQLDLDIYRGSLHNVLDRACNAAHAAEFTAFARLCGDRPFMPLEDMQRGFRIMEESLHTSIPIDLVTSALPRPVPAGLLTEVIRTDALVHLRKVAASHQEKEHVSYGFYQNPELYNVYQLNTPLQDLTGVHLSVDSEPDRLRISSLIAKHPDASFPAILAANAQSPQ